MKRFTATSEFGCDHVEARAYWISDLGCKHHCPAELSYPPEGIAWIFRGEDANIDALKAEYEAGIPDELVESYVPFTHPKYEIGDQVIFINDNGMNWGRVTITGHEWDEVRGNIYEFTPTETPLFKTSERHLFDMNDVEAINAATKGIKGAERCDTKDQESAPCQSSDH